MICARCSLDVIRFRIICQTQNDCVDVELWSIIFIFGMPPAKLSHTLFLFLEFIVRKNWFSLASKYLDLITGCSTFTSKVDILSTIFYLLILNGEKISAV